MDCAICDDFIERSAIDLQPIVGSPTERGPSTHKAAQGNSRRSCADIDFTMIPTRLDAKFEKLDSDNALRATIIKTSGSWTRFRQENLLTKMNEEDLSINDIRSEKNKALDLLDALSRSGSLPISCAELHVVVAVTHCFEDDVMDTVIQHNINPIEKVEKSTLLIASTIHGTPDIRTMLIQSPPQVARLEGAFPELFDVAAGTEGD